MVLEKSECDLSMNIQECLDQINKLLYHTNGTIIGKDLFVEYMNDYRSFILDHASAYLDKVQTNGDVMIRSALLQHVTLKNLFDNVFWAKCSDRGSFGRLNILSGLINTLQLSGKSLAQTQQQYLQKFTKSQISNFDHWPSADMFKQILKEFRVILTESIENNTKKSQQTHCFATYQVKVQQLERKFAYQQCQHSTSQSIEHIKVKFGLFYNQSEVFGPQQLSLYNFNTIICEKIDSCTRAQLKKYLKSVLNS